MSTNATTRRDEKASTAPDGASHLGTDAAGRDHYATLPPRPEIVVIDDGERTLKETLDDDHTVADWVDHVESAVGWERNQFGQSMGEHLVEALRNGGFQG
jgi:hypothetical protein